MCSWRTGCGERGRPGGGHSGAQCCGGSSALEVFGEIRGGGGGSRGRRGCGGRACRRGRHARPTRDRSAGGGEGRRSATAASSEAVPADGGGGGGRRLKLANFLVGSSGLEKWASTWVGPGYISI
jgi:hypothetical protein